jgi:hypothetical protein
MSYPVMQADARKREELKYGNISSVQILRGGHESGRLGGHRFVLRSLWGNDRRSDPPRAGRFSVFAAAVGTGAGLATSHESCVVRLDYLPPWRGQVVPESPLDLPGWCPSFPSWRRLRLPSGGRWRDRRKIRSSEVNNGPNGHTQIGDRIHLALNTTYR